ncbi:MAG: MFS transporter [Dehalococcoidia bacterium]|nr:MFS transporter [Dehalococcoidia bacterium]
MTPTARLHRALPATASRDFNYVWLAATASSIALWTMLLGNAWVVYELSDSSAWVAVAVFASMFPFFLAPIGGLIADRFERRTLLLFSRAGALAGMTILFLIAAFGILEVWIVVVGALGLGLVRSTETPADQALVANVVGKEAIANAVVLSTTTRLGARAVGPLIAGPLLETIGVEGAYGVAVAFGILATLFVVPVHTRSLGGVTDLREFATGLREGIRYVRNTGPVLAVFIIVVAHCVLTMSFDSMLPGFASHDLHLPTRGFTALSVAVGAGAFIGTLSLALLTRGNRGTLFLAMIIISGIGPIFLAMSNTLPAAATSAMIMGASQAVTMALAAVFLQEVVDDAVRGRVMSLYLMSAGGLMAFANLGYGAMADIWGAPILLLIPGIGFLAIVAATIATNPHLRRVYGTGTLVPAPAAAGA